MEKPKKRISPNFPEVEDDDLPSQTNPKRTCNSFSIGCFAFPSSEAESAIQAKIATLLRLLVRKELDRQLKASHILQSSSSNNQGNDQNEEATVVARFETKFKLCFLNQIPSTIFTNNEIEAENGGPLQVALVDVNNSIICMGPLSMAQLEFVALNGDSSEFDDESILIQRVGKRPLLVGNDLKLHLKNGVGLIKSLRFTDNSSWLRSKKIRLGVRITDDNILGKFPRIGEAISQPFRVLEHRGEVNKKHHPPKREDPVWRLEGISKGGVYHRSLSFDHGIKTVHNFLTTYDEKGPHYLRKLLGKKVSDKTWIAMVRNALECVPIANIAPNFEMQDLVGNKAIENETFEEGNLKAGELSDSNDHYNKLLGTTLGGLHEEWDSLFFNLEDP